MRSTRQFSDGWFLGPTNQSRRSLRVRVQILLMTLLVLTNVIGAAVVFGITFLVTPGGAPEGDYLLALAIAVPAYVVLAVIIGATSVTLSTLRALRWSNDDRDPTPEERRTALRLPWRMTLIQGASGSAQSSSSPNMRYVRSPRASSPGASRTSCPRSAPESGSRRGRAVAGNVGSRSRFEYAVIGDAVNAAARLTELAKDVEGRVPVSSASVDLAEDGEQAHWAPDGSPVLRGQDTPTPTSRLA